MLEEQQQDHTEERKPIIGWVVLFVVVMIMSSIFFFSYPFPGGKATIGGFIIIWFRELILVGVLVVLLGYWVIKKIKALHG